VKVGDTSFRWYDELGEKKNADSIISYTRNKISYKRRAQFSETRKGGTVGAGSMGWPATSGGWIG
jgi:hypothetical protein